MAYNGSGAFTIDTAGNPVSNGTTIDPSVHNTTLTEIATGLTTAICKDGQTTITQNIPFNNKKITGLAAATARTDGASLATIQDGTGVYVATVGGTADVITLTASPAITAYAAGQTFRFIASGANTTNVTVNVSGLGAKAITKNGTTALVAGDIPSGTMVEITYDGTRFILGTLGASFSATGGTIVGDTTLSVSDARTNTVDVPLTITSVTSNTPAAGIGTGILLKAESGDENPSDFGQIEAAATDVGAGTEDTYFQFLTRVAGAALTATYRFIATAANKAIFTHANTADRTYTLPDATGNLPTIAAQAEVNAMTSTTTAITPNHNKIVTGTVASLSGVSVSITGIPSGVRRVTISINGLSTNGTSDYLFQLGDAGGIENSGYLGSGGNSGGGDSSSTAGFIILNNNAANVFHFNVVLVLQDPATFTWVCHIGGGASNTAATVRGGGSKSLSQELTQLLITTVGGVNTFDAGTYNVTYER